jgi:hypothetical protein
MRAFAALGVSIGSAVALSVLSSSCYHFEDDCHNIATCPPGTGSSSSSTGATSSSGGHLNCDPTRGAIDATCGVFVSSSSGDDGNSGTQGAPLKSMAAAMTKTGAGRVYACGEIFTEAVTVTSGTTLHGALDCANGWVYDPQKKTVLTAAAGDVPLTLTSTVVGAEVLDFKIAAADATAVGGSSIAVVADHATATFTRCDLVAGNASDGGPGVSGGAQAMPADPGLNGKDAGTMGALTGGSGGANVVCSLQGGKGGDGGLIPNANGSDGAQGDGTQGGAKGDGDTGSGCTPGGQGSNGINGPFGPVMLGIGSIDGSGYHGIDGQPGMNGSNGTSGGGGGGSKAMNPEHGAGGGGGGAGGCAGNHGGAGTAAGSSIALISLSASVSLVSCTLGAAKAGNGGGGGDGQKRQLGGAAGTGGNGATAASGCNGGKGGDGGNGGNGSGGLGGHSLGIAATGTAPVLDAATKAATTFGAKGTGGKGGNMDADMNHGTDGMAAPCWDFAADAACK